MTGAGSNQQGTPEGYWLRGHHWPERWVLQGRDGHRTPELFIAGELLSAGGRAVVEVMLVGRAAPSLAPLMAGFQPGYMADDHDPQEHFDLES